jgi:pyruvate formate lyase activating enzyme
MSGGCTLSGGEPLMRDRLAVKLLTAAKGMGINTALDTNGGLGARLSNTDLEHIDLVLLDLKCWNPELHRRLTGMENGPALDFARRLAARKTPIWLRYVLVPGLTDRWVRHLVFVQVPRAAPPTETQTPGYSSP